MLSKPDIVEYVNSIPGNIDAKAVYLVDKYKVKAKVRDNFLLLDYHMLESPRKHPVVDQMRGLVLRADPVAPHKVTVARRLFDRFYNLGEYPDLEKKFEWGNAIVEDKCDGSLIGVWFNEDAQQWEVGTRGNAFGDNEVATLDGTETDLTFKKLFLRAFPRFNEFFHGEASSAMCRHVTYIFELCCLENRVVTRYEGDTVFLLNFRSNLSPYTEATPDAIGKLAAFLRVKAPTRHKLDSFEAVQAALPKLGDLKEGFVLRDAKDNRIKAKTLAYVAAHHLRGEGMSPKRAMGLALAGEVEEFCSYFPEYKDLLAPWVLKVESVRAEVEAAWQTVLDIPCQKLYAQRVREGYPEYQSLLFTMRNRKVSYDEALAGLTESGKLRLFMPCKS